MNKLILTTAALALTAGMSFADTIRMGTEGAYPPYNFINDAGEVDGFERKLGDELCARAMLTCEWGQRLGQHHSKPSVRQLRHHHCRHVDHSGA